jgi:ABC-type sugar transport system substrate-binding protein
MKKLISILLALAVLTFVASCGKTEVPSTSSPPVNDPAPPGGGAPADEHVGYWDDPVDHYARDTYKIIYYSFQSDASIDRWYDAMVRAEDHLNIKVDFQTANQDNERFNNNLELLANKYDGMLIAHDKPTESSTKEILDSLDTPWVSFTTPFLDEKMYNHWPTIAMDGYAVGEQATQWLIDHYKDYWGEIDLSKLGYITVTLSTLDLFYPRSDASEALFKEKIPEGLYIEGDVPMGSAFTAETAYNMISAYVSAHPEVEYWWINPVLMVFAPGCARAIEQLGISDNTLMTCCESQTAVTEWDSGYTGSWVSSVGIAEPLYSCPALAGLVALIDGRATPQTLWGDTKREPYGSEYAVYPLETGMITREDYKQYFEDINKYYYGED